MSEAGSSAARPRVAAVVATYNGAAFIREQLDSIRRQSRPPDLVVISDDGSRDATLRLCEEYARVADVPTCIVHRPQGAPASAGTFDRITDTFVRGIQAADAVDLVALSDQDDVWFDDRLERSLESLRQAPAACFTFGDGEVVDAEGVATGDRLSEHFPRPPDWNEITPAEQLRFALRRPFATGATMLVTSRLVRAALPVPRGWLHDRWMSIIGSALGGSHVIAGSVIHYRLHEEQHLGIRGASSGRSRLAEVISGGGSLLTPARKLRDVRSRVRALDVTDDVRAQVSWLSVAKLGAGSLRDRT